ncbi:MAG: DUF86 domain-containing protein [Proteobacteria bacterium]|nr:DUF86 domain-containing protein [Pseudomonadota bacterium]
MIEAIRRLQLSSYEEFAADSRNSAAAESFLRRALESLFDLGRHVLAKAFASTPSEYKEIALVLTKNSVISREEGRTLREMAGYRNRMVHLYHEISEEELYHICLDNLIDIEKISDAISRWLREHPDKVDTGL